MAGANAVPWRKVYAEGLKLLHTESREKARAKFAQAIDAGATAWQPFYARAWALVGDRPEAEDEEFRQAEGDLLQALRLGGPDCPDAAGLLGEIYERRGEDEAACKYLLMAVGHSSRTESVEERLIGALTRLLDALETSENWETSIAACERLEKLVKAAKLSRAIADGVLAEILATRAFCRQENAEPQKAEEDLRQVARLVPDHPRVPESLRRPAGVSVPTGGNAAPEPTFDDVGGRDVEKTFQARLCMLFDAYFGHANIEALRKRLQDYGQLPTRLVLLFGPSGCGKTYLIRAFAGEYRRRSGRELPIHRLRLNEVMNKWVGESEKALTRLVDEAISTQPSILFADEVDAIGMSREGGQDWRVGQTAHFLQELDRLQSAGAFVIFFGCTNRVDAVDLALLRRFDQLVPVELPNEAVRARMFAVHLKRLSPRVQPKDLNVDALAKVSHGLTAGDIDKVVRRAVDDLLAEQAGGRADAALTQADLLRAAKEYRRPMHVREWVRQSVQALRKAGHTEMAVEVEQMYGPYLDDGGVSTAEGPAWRMVPEEAWTEEQSYDLCMFRNIRSHVL